MMYVLKNSRIEIDAAMEKFLIKMFSQTSRFFRLKETSMEVS
jgi:hypothetical protein